MPYGRKRKSFGGARSKVVQVSGGGSTSFNSLFPSHSAAGANALMVSAADETGALYVSHREFIGNTNSSINFLNQSQLITPTNGELFPWLAQIANNYSEFQFHSLVFEYRSLTANLSTTSAQVGEIISCVNYNAGDKPFDSDSEMLNYYAAVSCKINDNMMLGVECNPRKNGLGPVLFVPEGGRIPTDPPQDIKTYALGTWQQAVEGTQTSGNILGQTWVHYRITLRKPKIQSGLQYQQFAYWLSNGARTSDYQFLGATPANVVSSTSSTAGAVVSPVVYVNSGSVVTNVYLTNSMFTANYLANNFSCVTMADGANNPIVIVRVPDGVSDVSYVIVISFSGATGTVQNITWAPTTTGNAAVDVGSQSMMAQGESNYTSGSVVFYLKITNTASGSSVAGPMYTGNGCNFSSGGITNNANLTTCSVSISQCALDFYSADPA